MKRKWFLFGLGLIIILGTLALTGCGAPTAAQVASPVRVSSQPEGIWVSGTGEVMVAPDIAILRLGVVAQEATVAEAQSKASEGMNNVMKALTGGGVQQKDIQTGSFNINQRTRYDQVKQMDTVIGYQVSNMVMAKIRSLPQESYPLDYKLGRIIDSAVQAGGDLIRISGISFSVDDPTSYYQQAREKAMADARNKAEQLAKLAGVTLGKPTYVAEGAQSSPIYSSYSSGGLPIPAPMPASAPPISPGENKITLTVQVAYGILQ